MRVCLFVQNFLPLMGGSEFVVHYLADALCRQGVGVTVLPHYLAQRGELRFPYDVHQYRPMPGLHSDVSQSIALLAERVLHGFDLLHAHQLQAAGVALRLKRLLRVPIVATAHGADVQTVPEIGYGQLCQPEAETRARQILRSVDGLVAISNRIRDRMLELGADAGKIELIPNGSAFAGLDPAVKATKGFSRSGLGIADDALVTITVGRPSRIKGYEFLWKALDSLHGDHYRVESIIVGTDPEDVQTVYGDMTPETAGRIGPHLHWPGRVPSKSSPQQMLDSVNHEMAAHYRLADVYVCTSYTEAFSLTIHDAMCAGLPVILPETAGNADLVRDGENGFIVPPKDPSAVAERLRWLAENRDECRRMGEQARRTAMRYSWDEVARMHIGMYERVVNDSRQRSG